MNTTKVYGVNFKFNTFRTYYFENLSAALAFTADCTVEGDCVGLLGITVLTFNTLSDASSYVSKHEGD